MAKSGQMEAVKIMAKDLVRTRNFVKKFILMRANIQAIALKVQTLKSQAAMANAMKGEGSMREREREGERGKWFPDSYTSPIAKQWFVQF